MDRAWAAIVFSGGLLLGLAAGFYFWVGQDDPGITMKPAPPLAERIEPPLQPEPPEAATPRLLELDAELAALKTANIGLKDDLLRAEQRSTALEEELRAANRERDRLRDQVARLQRALAETPLPATAAPPVPPPASPPAAPEHTVRILQIDASQQVLALDRGEPDGLLVGTRWELRAGGNDFVPLEITEARPTFAIARRIESEKASSLELARGRAYVLKPLP